MSQTEKSALYGADLLSICVCVYFVLSYHFFSSHDRVYLLFITIIFLMLLPKRICINKHRNITDRFRCVHFDRI